MNQKKKTAVEVYLSTVYKWGILILIIACMSATVTLNLEKMLQLYPTVSWVSMIGLVVLDSTLFVIGLYLAKTSFDEEGYVKENCLKRGKIFSVILLIVQWNYLLYAIPSRTFWGFLFFFLILIAFFLDIKLLCICGIGCLSSLVLAWLIKGKDLLPLREDALYLTDIILCIIALILSIGALLIFVYFVSHFLVNAKKDELEKNNEHVTNILLRVQEISQKLNSAGKTLAEISSNESASAEELAATSEQLVESSNLLSSKTDESMRNLSELREWESVVADNVLKVKDTSAELFNKSKDNEDMLNNLSVLNTDVSNSMALTNEVTQKLSDAVSEIGVTLSIISEIAASTNLLALNASIEAARAGEFGRGFAVVATEVGNLAKTTQQSLEEVKNIITKVEDNVTEITKQVMENTEKLNKQNEYFADVFSGLKDMNGLLNVSVDAIKSMDEAHQAQADVIKQTVSINQDIADNVRLEHEQFEVLTAMAEGNTQDTVDVLAQADTINSMVEDMSNLLYIG